MRAKGPVVRAEAAADDRFGALDLAMDKLAERLRRARDRRKDHRNHTVVPPVDVRPYDPATHEAPPPPAPTAPTEPGRPSRRRSATRPSSSGRSCTGLSP